MNSRLTAAFLGASLSVLAVTGSAQSASAADADATGASGAGTATLGEIVVTARRKSESAQSAPLTVNAVKADTVQKLNIRQFADVQGVVPGLALKFDAHGSGSSVSLRGVNFTVAANTQPTVALYLNDAPIEANFIFHSMFDVGQIEVLKGPQGTLRGISAPSGAITLTTRRPDLGSYGGYVDGTYADQNGRNVQGAFNIPIIRDVLAIRGAAVWDQNNGDAVTSIHSPSKPRQITKSERISVIYQPTDNLTANLTYQHLDSAVQTFTQVVGQGPGAFTIGATAYGPNFNPPISASQRLAVADAPSHIVQRNEVVTGNIDYQFLGQRLSYDGSYSILKFKSVGGSDSDSANIVPNFDFGDSGLAEQLSTTHELRLSSEPSPDRHFDYTVGAFYRWYTVCCNVTIPSILTGAFGPGAAGPPSATSAANFNPAYILPTVFTYPGSIQEESLFGGLTFHLPWDTELSGGVRHIWMVYNSSSSITTGPGLIFATPLSTLIGFGLPSCAAAGLQTSLRGSAYCDAFIPQTVGSPHIKSSETPTIYNVSLSHKITPDFMVYASTGTSYRPPALAIGVQGVLSVSPPGNLNSLIHHPSESSTSYEIGFKSTWFDHRARLNVALYRQTFDGMVVIGPPITYKGAGGNLASFSFAQSVTALVQGFDIDTGLQISHDWSVTAQASYADGKNQGTPMPCNTFDPVTHAPTFTDPSGLISMCPNHGSVSQAPLWSATLSSEYTHPITNNVDGFVRGLASYFPQNTRVQPNFTVGSYALVNLYAGVRSHDGAWEASLFAKNLFNTTQQTDQNWVGLSNGLFAAEVVHPSGYLSATETLPRQVGVNIHYAWGSR